MSKKINYGKSISLLVISAVLCLVAAIDASAAAYIKFDGVDGESQDKDHKGWSDILSFQQAVRVIKEDATSQTRRRQVVLDDIVVVRELDKSSPKLAQALLTGQVIPRVTIQLTRRGADSTQPVFYAYELKNVIVTSYSIGGGAQSDQVPTEEFSLNFEEIKVTYTEFDETGASKGNVEYSWKVEEGEA